jgi:hypothetical protein
MKKSPFNRRDAMDAEKNTVLNLCVRRVSAVNFAVLNISHSGFEFVSDFGFCLA